MIEVERNILAFAGSNSSRSINHRLVSHALKQFSAKQKTLLKLADFPLPIYGIDLEEKEGIPAEAIQFYEHVRKADLIIISLAEHNGSYTAVFKNLLDWMSRHHVKCFENKKLFLLSTSPGGRGGKGVMDAALSRFPRHGAEIVGHFSLPHFKDHFSDAEGIRSSELRLAFETALKEVENHIASDN